MKTLNFNTDTKYTVKFRDLVEKGWDFIPCFDDFDGNNPYPNSQVGQQKMLEDHGESNVDIYVRVYGDENIKTAFELEGWEEMENTGDDKQTLIDLQELSHEGKIIETEGL